MFDNLLSYYIRNSQKQINNRIEEINQKRKELKSSGDVRYKRLTSLKPTHLYANKPSLIKVIRESEPNILKEKFTVKIAESLKNNIKLKPDLKTASNVKEDEIKMKRNNLEFISLQEILWGFDDEFEKREVFNFFINLFLDLEEDPMYSSIINELLMQYVPYARYIGMKKIENYCALSISNESYKDDNVDVYSEAVFKFCKSKVATEIMERFKTFLNEPFTYESKDKNGRFLMKEGIVNFQNFEQAFSQNLKFVLEPLSDFKDFKSLGKRVYEIILDNCIIEQKIFDIFHLGIECPYREDMEIELQEREEDILFDFQEKNLTYIKDIIQFQKKLEGDIEEEYFESSLFSLHNSQYFSQERFIELIGKKQEELFLEEVEKYFRDRKIEEDKLEEQIEKYLKSREFEALNKMKK